MNDITGWFVGGYSIYLGDELVIKDLFTNVTYRATVDCIFKNLGDSVTVSFSNVRELTSERYKFKTPDCLTFGVQFYEKDWIIMAKKENGEYRYKNIAFNDNILNDSPIILKTN